MASLLAVTGLLAAACSGSSKAQDGTGGPADKPNVVFVLTDDLSMNLVQYMPHVLAMQKAGATFENYTVTDSLCCPSRASIFSGKFPHDTGIFTNGRGDGGFDLFHARGEEKDTYATALQARGYRTAMMGKYLNHYEPNGSSAAAGKGKHGKGKHGKAATPTTTEAPNAPKGSAPSSGAAPVPKGYVPPGWNEWDVAGNGYGEFDYDLNENGKVVHHGSQPSDYLTDVISAKGSDFIDASAKSHSPFIIELATFAPHAPSTPAPRDEKSFPGLKAPRPPSFDHLPSDAPAWLATRPGLKSTQTASIDEAFRKRVQSVQAVDRMIGSLQATLDKAGVAENTMIVFSSDNGYHMGEYRLTPGKMTAFDTDINVPLVVTGPSIPAGKTITQPAENIDLTPTFESLAGAPVPDEVDGRSLLPLLHGESVASWRNAALVEHHGPDHDRTDPDKPTRSSGNPPTYEAIRTTTYTYVEYLDGSREYYDRTKDPDQLHNIAANLPAARIAQLHAAITALQQCHGGSSCAAAGRSAP